MSIQLALRFDEVPITCETQQRYHSISPCLAGKRSAEEQADALGLSYSTVCRWLRQFREEGMPRLFPATEYPREPQTPEHVIVALLFYKTCAPRASDRELARVLSATTDHRIHNETVKALLERYPLWRYPDFRELSAGWAGLSGHAYNKLPKAHQKAYGERGYRPHAQAANSMSMGLIRERAQFDFMPLSECPDAIPQVAHWWCDEWGLPQRHESMESYLSELASLKPGKLPIHLLALSERNIVGVATLKDQSALHKLFPDFQYWLSGVYVPPALRSRGIATALCLKMVDIAKTRGVTRLHLVTEVLDGGLYAKIGWNPIRQVHVDDLDLLVMARDVP